MFLAFNNIILFNSCSGTVWATLPTPFHMCIINTILSIIQEMYMPEKYVQIISAPTAVINNV